MRKSEDEGGRRVKSVDTSIRIAEGLLELEGAGITELANELGLTKGTIHTHLSTLYNAGYVVKKDETYTLSLKYLEIGDRVRNSHPLYRVGKPFADDLAEKSGEVVHLSVEEKNLANFIYAARGSKSAIQTVTPVGGTIEMHATAAGKAILAFASEEKIRDVIEENGLPALTTYTITDSDELLSELATVRERGYAVNDQEQVLGARTIGAPIQHPTSGVLGAITVSGPASRFDESYRSHLVGLVIESANRIEIQFG